MALCIAHLLPHAAGLTSMRLVPGDLAAEGVQVLSLVLERCAYQQSLPWAPVLAVTAECGPGADLQLLLNAECSSCSMPGFRVQGKVTLSAVNVAKGPDNVPGPLCWARKPPHNT